MIPRHIKDEIDARDEELLLAQARGQAESAFSFPRWTYDKIKRTERATVETLLKEFSE